ncbi:hypothetical protein [Flammeovirga sp. EKP202]|uniref:hypothetical protein n=1 Tax=Flammeovirga sp. EKP202 TaxID=2770592 RepID=UPI00165F1BB6|nr:hypothetical protein [Flammeovirga sp. EKP202]MBD0404411.1 hypothetical protein [Flammeovirga sp. EKP202]
MKQQTSILFSILLFLLSFSSKAQVEVGLQFDTGGNPIHGYFDPLSFSSTVSVSKSLGRYIPGKVYDIEGNQSQYLMSYYDTKLYKKSAQGFIGKLDPKRYTSLMIGQDSFFVAQNIHFRGKLKKRKTYVQFVAEFDSTVFAKIYTFGIGGLIYQTYIAKKYEDEIWEEIHPKKKSIDLMVDHFFSKYDNVIAQSDSIKETNGGYISYLGFQYDENSNLDDNEVAGLINIAHMSQMYNDDEKVYYNDHFKEVKDVSIAKYYSKVKGIFKGYYTKQYYTLDDQLVYEIDYKNNSMNVLHGEYFMYYNGKIAIKKNIENNKVMDGDVYKDGKLIYIYKNVEFDFEGNITKCLFDFGQGRDFTGTFDFNDPFDNTMKQITVEKGLIKKITFTHDEQLKKYHVKYPKNLKFNRIGSLFQKYIEDQFFVFYDVYHPLLVKFNIDLDGYARSYQILNKVNEKFDAKVDEFIRSEILNGGTNNVTLSPKSSKEDAVLEVILPFELSFQKQSWFIYNRPDNYYKPEPINVLKVNQVPLPTF